MEITINIRDTICLMSVYLKITFINVFLMLTIRCFFFLTLFFKIYLFLPLSFFLTNNLEIYSTYLVDSVRPHLSAQRMINGTVQSGVEFYQRPQQFYDNSGDTLLLKSRLLTRRPTRQAEKVDDYEYIL